MPVDLNKLTDEQLEAYRSLRAGAGSSPATAKPDFVQAPQTVSHAIGEGLSAVNPIPGVVSALTHNPVKPGGIIRGLYDASADQGSKAKQAFGRGDYMEAFGHGLGMLPLVGPAAAAVGEKFGGKPPEFDRYGNTVTPGEKPDVAGGIGAGLTTLGAALAPGLASRGVKALPNAARAGRGLEAVEKAAGHVPLNITEPGAVALDIADFAKKGATMPKVAKNFLDWTTDPAKPPLTFGDARGFYSNAGRLSANEATRLTPPMRRLVGQFTNKLGTSLEDAAGTVGQRDPYIAAMREYRRAARLGEAVDTAKSVAKKVAIPAVIGGGALGYLAKRGL